MLTVLLVNCNPGLKNHSQSAEIIEVSKEAIIIIVMDSLEIEKVKNKYGEDVFYTSMDDLMWYNSILLQEMDSLKVPVIYSDKHKVEVKNESFSFEITKDSTFEVYTYFHFLNNKLERKELFDLIQ